MLKNWFKMKKGEIGITELIMVLGTILAIAIVLYIVFSIADSGLVISYD